MTPDHEPTPELIAEQLRHALDMIRFDIAALQKQADHDRQFMEHRIKSLESLLSDQETRIRSATDGVTTFKTWSGLAAGGSSILAIIAFIKSVLP
jgi:hypothetical protein